jgi:hypothetical protein
MQGKGEELVKLNVATGARQGGVGMCGWDIQIVDDGCEG